MNLSRRAFLGTSTAAVLAGATSNFARAADTPWKDVRVAVIGIRTQGWNHIWGINANVVALCDVDNKILHDRAGEFESRWGRRPALFSDYRELLERKDIDAVSIATPNHSHALITIAAAEAGKDVYVEKPVAHTIWEGRQMVQAARRYNRIIQSGTQSRSSPSLHEACSYLQNGELGKIRYAIGTCYKPRMSIGKLDKPLVIDPSVINYDLWCGPTPMLPIYRPSLHYDWHWDFNTGDGDLGNQGVHQMDIARWFLGESQLPPRAMCMGGRLGYEDAGDTPNSQVIYLDYPAAPLVFELRGLTHSKFLQGPELWPSSMDNYRGSQVGVVIQCEKGHMLIPSYTEAIAFDLQGKELKRWQCQGNEHHTNWFKAIVARDASLLNAPIQEGHVSAALCHAGNISYKVGTSHTASEILDAVAGNEVLTNSAARLMGHLRANGVNVDDREAGLRMGPWLEIDPAGERFTDNDVANSMRTREFRSPYVVPDLETASVASAG
jgi:predicted dehydrogenase